jgi:hypothetical protein
MRGDFRRKSVRDTALRTFQSVVRLGEEVQSAAYPPAEYLQ